MALLLFAGPTLAVAEETRSPIVHLAVAPVFGELLTKEQTKEPDATFASRSHGHGFGEQVDLGVAWGRTTRFGAMVRVTRLGTLDVVYSNGSGSQSSVLAKLVGPQLTINVGRAFIRADLGLGIVTTRDSPNRFGWEGGLELGYEHRLSRATAIQLGLGAMIATGEETGDTDFGGHYKFTERVLAVGLVGSARPVAFASYELICMSFGPGAKRARK